MGFFDKAKSSLSDRFGADEVVRKGSFGSKGESPEEELEEETPVREPRAKRQPKPKLPRAPKPPRKLPEPEEFQDGAFEDSEEPQDDYSFTEQKPQVIDTDQLVDLSKDQGQSVSDILKSMRISETFAIDDGILFVDEELATQGFATQAPYGYDMGEVDFFLGKTQRSVAKYVDLLRVRNGDVVKLATRVSDLMVELNNIRFNSEVANGINIMASAGDDDALAVELQEARSKASRLQEQLDRLQSAGAAPQEDPRELARLRDELAAERRGRSAAETDANDLRAHLALIEEEYDIRVFSDSGDLQAPSTESGFESYEEQRGGQFQNSSGADRAEQELYAEEGNYQKVGRDHWLPGLETEEGLPGLSYEEENLPDGGFEFEEESLEELPLGNFEQANGGFGQAPEQFDDSAFTQDPYQNLDEFIEKNLDGFPDDNSSSSAVLDGTVAEDDPDEDGFEYSFERRL